MNKNRAKIQLIFKLIKLDDDDDDDDDDEVHFIHYTETV